MFFMKISAKGKLVITIAKMSRETSVTVTGRSKFINQIATPLNAMMYVADSAELLNITVKINTDERISN